MNYSSNRIQNTSTTWNNANSPRKRKLRQSNKKLRDEIYRLKKRDKKRSLISDQTKNKAVDKAKFIELCDNFLPEKISLFVKTQVKLCDRKLKGERYSNAFKKFALSIYFLSPKCYKFLRSIFKLPSVTILNNLTKEWSYTPGLNDDIFRHIKIKLKKMEKMDRRVSLVIDEMSIKPHLAYDIKSDEIIGLNPHRTKKKSKDHTKIDPVDHVTVFMAVGIRRRYKQPLAYIFSKTALNGPELKHTVLKCIEKMMDAGFIVNSLISDMGSNFSSLAFKDLNITPEKPFFEVKDQKIFYFFDPPHLLKLTRNNLMSNYFEFEGEKTNWKYIQQFYDADSKLFFRLAPKLTDFHLCPKIFKKMRVKFAAHILSATVATAMTTHINLKAMDQDAYSTVEIIDKFDKLFDIFNSSTYQTIKKYRKPFSGKKYQVDYLNFMSGFIKKISVKHDSLDGISTDKTQRVKFLKGWQVSISSLLGLWEIFKNEDFKFLLMRRINQDPLENFFGAVRSYSGCCVNPTPIQFIRIFKKMFCSNFIRHTGKSIHTISYIHIFNLFNIK